MGKRFTLFTGQWADLTLEEVAGLAAGWGYDGLEIAVSGEHLDAWRWDEPGYVEGRLEILKRHGLGCWAISNHLTGQAICDDPIDDRHRAIVREKVWGDGVAGGRPRAGRGGDEADRAAGEGDGHRHGRRVHRLVDLAVRRDVPAGARGQDRGGLPVDFADRWHPILDVFEECGVRFAHEVHPSEIAYDYWTTMRTLEAIEHRPEFGINWDPSHMVWQDLDPVAFITDFADRIYHVDCKDTRMRVGGGRNGRLSSHLPWGDPHRGWDFVTAGRGDVPWEDCFRALAAIGYAGPISVEWEDAGMDRLQGAPEALEFLRRFDFEPPAASFDAAFSSD